MIVHGDHERPPAYSCSRNLTFSEVISASALRTRTAALVSELARGLERTGGVLTGHIKGLIDTSDKGHLFFSLTSSEEGARFKGLMTGPISAAVLTVNVVVYGIELRVIERMFQEVFVRHFGEQSS